MYLTLNICAALGDESCNQGTYLCVLVFCTHLHILIFRYSWVLNVVVHQLFGSCGVALVSCESGGIVWNPFAQYSGNELAFLTLSSCVCL